jgi:hypothetical protein
MGRPGPAAVASRAMTSAARLAGCCVVALGLMQSARAQSAADCVQAGSAAEQRFGLPPGLLLAIGRVESGRWDARLGRLVPWPWTVDVDGEGRLFDSSSDAVAAARAAQATGRRSIDVGCFQISLLHHPDAFADLEQAFDPQANAQYAARFLASLQARLGNWHAAVAAYHSATPELGLAYSQRVFATWPGTAAISPIITAQFEILPGIHVWTPSAAGAAPEVIAVHTAFPPALPRIITPGQ